MNGLELSRQYWETCGRNALAGAFPDLAGRVSVGLVGEGSDCFGYDDEISRDHSWGPGFCLWLDLADAEREGEALQAWYQSLPDTFGGVPVKTASPDEPRRTGVFESVTFYRRLLGKVPQTPAEWLDVPESQLAACVNGAIFEHADTQFERIRGSLLRGYPDDVRRWKLAACCAEAAQAGQYNYARCLCHGELLAAREAETSFLHAAVHAVFLLNRAYCPFYKWMYRRLRELPVLGAEVSDRLLPLSGLAFAGTDLREVLERNREIAALLQAELNRQGLTEEKSDFLLDQCGPLLRGIGDPDLRRRPVRLAR